MNEQKHIIIKDSHSTFILPQTCLALPIFDNQGGEEEVEEEEVDADAEENQWKYYAKSTSRRLFNPIRSFYEVIDFPFLYCGMQV